MEIFEDLNKQLNLNYKSNNDINWKVISYYYNLSEDFINKYNDKVDWNNISKYQKLSEQFIEKYKNKINWNYISVFQILSENFIEKYYDKVDWYYISMYQTLSESFIEKFKDYVYWYVISIYQNLSEKFIKDNNIYIDKFNWLYKDTEFKKQQIINSSLYECYDDYFIAYKPICQDRYSIYNFQYKYEPGKVYESTCDCTINENSFGLNVGTYDYVKKYYKLMTNKNNYNIVKCKIKYEDAGRLIEDNNKVRCFKIEIL